MSKKIRTATIASTSSDFTHTRIPLFDLYTPGNDKSSECSEVCIIQDLILSDQYLTLNSKEKVPIFDFSDLNSSSEMGPFQMDIQILEYSPF